MLWVPLEHFAVYISVDLKYAEMSHSFVPIAKFVWIKWQFKLSFLSVEY